MNKKIFITSIADKYKATPEDILLHLAKHNIILAAVTNGRLETESLNGIVSSTFDVRDIPISNKIVQHIATHGIWQGDRIDIWHEITQIKEWKNWFTEVLGRDGSIELNAYKARFSHVTFEEKISLTSNHLFVYEDEFSQIEQTLLKQPPTGSVTTTAPPKTKKTYRRGAISASAAANILGVSERQVQNWDSGIHRPDGYPGRRNEAAFQLFANEWMRIQQLNKQARAMNQAISNSGVVDRATKSGFDDDDD